MNGTDLTPDIPGNLTDEDESWIKNSLSLCLEGVLLPILALFGIVGNILCLFVFNQKKVELKPSFSNILKCLSVFDILFLVGMVLLYTVPRASSTYRTNIEPVILPVLLPLTQVTLTGSVYSVVAVAVERYYTICRPFKYNMMGECKGLPYIMIIIIFSFVYNINKFFELTTISKLVETEAGNHSVYVNEMTPLRKNATYTTVYILYNTCGMGILPIFLLTFLNNRIVRDMKQATRIHNNISKSQRRDGAMSALLTGIVVVLVICHSPKTIINMLESYQTLVYGDFQSPPGWGNLVIKVSHLLLTFSSAANILIYSYKDFRFRTILASFCSFSHPHSDVSSRGEGSIGDHVIRTNTNNIHRTKETIL
ncbi:FMRFamide receptor [Eurytemora carolleeae]|uniref:FMRFamide receptor n=1 Tax=Eurytemora carolleeae TaxID=1294199 RepID=UPI000C767445|nr:FMRFamide receptor [Eurytemora carolleeae]|eukprot:XP_023337723.1 FMRFamide receptor-like [Eurytemora affinis]